MSPSRSDRIIASILIPFITLPLIYLGLNFVQYQIITPPMSFFKIISNSMVAMLIGLPVFGFANPIPLILKLILFPLAFAILSTKKILALILMLLEILFISYSIIYSVLLALNYPIKESITLSPIMFFIMFFIGIPFLSLLPICWVSLVGYQDFKDLIKKLIIPILILILVIVPAIKISSNLRELIAKNNIVSVHRPKYLPKQVDITYPETIAGTQVDWWYSCSQNGAKTLTASFFITMQKLGEKDIITKQEISLESTLNSYKKGLENFDHNPQDYIKEVRINNQPGFIYHRSNDYYLYWTTPKSLVNIWTSCPKLDEQELLKVAESM